MALPQDAILLIDDGCYNLHHPALLETLAKQQALSAYFVHQHANARAQSIAQSAGQSAFSAIELNDVLGLIFKHDNSVTWS